MIDVCIIVRRYYVYAHLMYIHNHYSTKNWQNPVKCGFCHVVNHQKILFYLVVLFYVTMRCINWGQINKTARAMLLLFRGTANPSPTILDKTKNAPRGCVLGEIM